ncbi:11139_t:CDS:2 [Entrophospora sp. SA101]|nr:11139_t:CDS:2 [Entrophospora sp. SA101]
MIGKKAESEASNQDPSLVHRNTSLTSSKSSCDISSKLNQQIIEELPRIPIKTLALKYRESSSENLY